jgi:mono/diheme cytochrome c family protein
MTISDLRDLFAYLKTLPAVSGRVRDHDLPFPFTIRWLVGAWKWLFLDGKPFTPDASQSAEWNRGAYLVNGPGHCAECHSSRDATGGILSAQRFAGGFTPDGKGWVPNITQQELADWSVNDIAYLLETGMTPDGDSVGGSMAEVVRNTGQIGDADRLAMATYIKMLKPIKGPSPPSKKK